MDRIHPVADPRPAGGQVSEARRALNGGLVEAERTERLVFLHSGAPWCGWRRRLEDWLVREEIEYMARIWGEIE